MKLQKSNQLDEFTKLLSQFDAPSFMGLAKILCVYVFDNDKKDEQGRPLPRAADDIIQDCIISFGNLNRAKRREVLRIMRMVVKSK